MKLFYAFLCILLLSACGKKGVSVPKDVLPFDKMAEVMTDVQLADAASREHLLPQKYSERHELWLFDILNKHKTDTATYFRSLRFYSENIELLDSLNTLILVKLE